MKKYRYIVIDKNNMKQIQHYPTSDSVRMLLYGKRVEDFIIIIKDEITIIDWSKLARVDDALEQTHKIWKLLDVS